MAETPDETAELRQEVAELKDRVRVLTDAVDELREELQWLTRNGLPRHEPPAVSPVLKQMAADPTADDWNEQLVIARGEAADQSRQADAPSASGGSSAPASGDSGTEPGDGDTLF